MNKKVQSNEHLQDASERIHRWVVLSIGTIMAIDFVVVMVRGQWLTGMLILVIGLILLAPTLLKDRIQVKIPYEFQLIILIFVFAALFLGEIRSFYYRFWWWDIVLHVASGFLLGIFGFLLIYVLNENKNVNMSMKPRFIALFAFAFSVAIGVIWEIFEYTMDSALGANMQKPMLGDPTGLTDTMWDLIVDTIGAAAIAGLGWWHMERNRESFVDAWIHKFIEKNPDWFRR
jgi:uncharacterized membrane protein YjdF